MGNTRLIYDRKLIHHKPPFQSQSSLFLHRVQPNRIPIIIDNMHKNLIIMVTLLMFTTNINNLRKQ